MCFNHQDTISFPLHGTVEKSSSTKLVPGAKNIRDRCSENIKF